MGRAFDLPQNPYFMSSELNFKPEVAYSWINDPDDEFKPTVEKIVKGTVTNPLFPLAQTKALNIKALYLVYGPTVVDPGKRNSDTAAARVAARTPLEAALRDFLPDIQAESGGSLTALLSTNIPLVRVPTTSQMPIMPGSINLYLFGNPTQLYAQCEAQIHSKFYEARVSSDQVAFPWTATSSKSAVGFVGLPAGQTLYVQMRVTNAIGPSEWSASKPFMIPAVGVTIPEVKRPRGLR